MDTVTNLASKVGVRAACDAFCLPKSTFYHRNKTKKMKTAGKRKREPDFAYSSAEKEEILSLLCSEKYCDLTPYEIYYNLLDEGKYYCSIRTMYRILKSKDMSRERRNIKTSNCYVKPELLATRPNEVWSWDITKIKTPLKWTYFYLYVMIDIYSRYIVGWMIAYRESEVLATKFIKEICERQNIKPSKLTIHADRGSSMRSKSVAMLMSDLQIIKTHSRPHVSNDNPYSESAFKTVKYHQGYPSVFPSIEQARSFFGELLNWYNTKHYHSGLSFFTPESVHYGFAEKIRLKRQLILDSAFEENKARFRFIQPKCKSVPNKVWINKPNDEIQNK
jgi:putative transposase